MMIAGVSLAAREQERPRPAALIAAQHDAMTRLANMDGVWRGPAWTILPSGEKHTMTQTERIGPFLDGSVRVIEGRGYDPDGKVTFSAFGTISFNPTTKVYTLHSHAMGNVGDFVLTLTPDGYTWDIPAGPMTIRYTSFNSKASAGGQVEQPSEVKSSTTTGLRFAFATASCHLFSPPKTKLETQAARSTLRDEA